MSKHLLPLIPAGLTVVQVLPTPDRVTIVAHLRSTTATCPDCGAVSQRVHSRYERALGDLPWQGRPVVLRVQARRFRCLDPACPRQTFSERLASIAAVAARRTERLGGLQRHLGLALGGEAGARLAERLAMVTSPDTLLRMVRIAGAGAGPPPATPRVLAVDDWAWRRGHRYGTVLVDLERNRVVDLLPDRQAETLAAWLRAHPGIEAIARDRAGAYADGARQGAPEAVQVADRWHLLRNVGDALRHAVERHHAALRRIGREIAAELAAAGEPAPRPELVPTALERRRAEARARRQALYDEAVRLREGGATLNSIAAALGTPPRTLAYWFATGHAPLRDRRPAGSILDPFRGYLERRYAEGCRNARQLWRELREQGFQGRPSIVRVWIGRWNKAGSGSAPTATPSRPRWKPPSVYAVTRLLTSPRDSAPDSGDQRLCARLLAQVPELAAAADAARRLARVLRKESAESLTDVLAATKETLLNRLATSLEGDMAAVQAALDTPWTTSPAEGQINRLKTLKRAMYGRAGFPLLRARVLHAA